MKPIEDADPSASPQAEPASPAEDASAESHDVLADGPDLGNTEDGDEFGADPMRKPDAGFDYNRYRKLLAEAVDEPRRLALINLLVDEKAKDSLAAQNRLGMIRSVLATSQKPHTDE